MEAAKDRRDAVEDPAASVLYLIAPEKENDADSNKLDLEAAFKWSGVDIIKWIRAVISNVQDHRKAKLTEMANLLETLCFRKRDPVKDMGKPMGAYVVGATFKEYLPGHHIARTRENRAKRKDPVPQWYYTLKPLNRFGVSLFSPYDVLGYLLMTLGIEPPNADKQSFYLPLTAMYAKWCSMIGGRADTTPITSWNQQQYRPGKWPTVYQCTWVGPDHNEKLNSARENSQVWGPPFRFALGASFAGCDFLGGNEDHGVRNSWRDRIVAKRKELLQVFKALDPDKTLGLPLANSPWGNCAETYAFLVMFRVAQNPEKLEGLAINAPFLQPELKVDSFSYDENSAFQKGLELIGPCQNCQHVIDYFLASHGGKNYQAVKDRWRP